VEENDCTVGGGYLRGAMSNNPTKEEITAGAVILVDKPYQWTSFDAINKIRRHINSKIGHAGTLDPLATGLLICCTGKMTKEITAYQRLPKEYTGVIQLGAVTPTFDLESTPQDIKSYEGIDMAAVQEAAKAFTGDIMQVPPAHSAIQKDGKRAYELARKGIEVKMEPRAVTIGEFEILKVEEGGVHFRVVCSTGTYIRSLANDLGAVLGSGGYLKELRRTKIGNYKAEDAMDVAAWVAYLEDGKRDSVSIPVTE